MSYSVVRYQEQPRAIGERGFESMHPNVDSSYSDCIAFVCTERQTGPNQRSIRPVATGFFVGLWEDEIKTYWDYAVTARHVVEDSTSEEIFLRVNKKSGGTQDLKTNKGDWFIHDDAALIPLPRPDNAQDLKLSVIPTSVLIHKDHRYRGPSLPEELIQRIGGVPVNPGDDVFFTGLFSQHAGMGTNIPIVRYGTVAQMPIEPITMKRDRGTTSYKALVYLTAREIVWQPLENRLEKPTILRERHQLACGDRYSDNPLRRAVDVTIKRHEIYVPVNW